MPAVEVHPLEAALGIVASIGASELRHSSPIRLGRGGLPEIIFTVGARAIKHRPPCSRVQLPYTSGNPFHSSIDFFEGRGSRRKRYVCQVDIDRQSRHVAVKKIDGGAALERKTFLFGDERQNANEERNLTPIFVVKRHRISPERLSDSDGRACR